mmetsp:Transcript_11263/g.27718  ORF Transcript_11263/g.27718 Transcript_11263/m.27718 type:complete len:1352 (-) Transcript_11263:591-4646(-)
MIAKISEKVRIDKQTGEILPKYSTDGSKIFIEMPTYISNKKLNPNIVQKLEIMPEKVYGILKNISKKNCEILGFDYGSCRPCWLIVYTLPIPPVYVRPYCKKNVFVKFEDDLTYKLHDIIKVNNRLQNVIAGRKSNLLINHYRNLLSYHINTYFDNSNSKLPLATQTSGKPIKGISQRLNGKYGRFRRNLLGKRVDFSARTVITGNSYISLEEIGVPEIISKKLTIPDSVNKHNIDKLSMIVDSNGINLKANYVIKGSDRKIDLRFKSSNSIVLLKYGYIVERHIIDGDLVVLNRQPSLHKMSMMGHRVKILPKLTFKLNLAITSPYNADFDGDEMNIHIPQTTQSMAETLMIMNAIQNIVSPQANKPVIGVVQDSLVSSYLVTRRSSTLSRAIFLRVMNSIKHFGTRINTIKANKSMFWGGKHAFNDKLSNIYLYNKSSSVDKEDYFSLNLFDKNIFINKGKLITGTISKLSIGNSPNSIHHILWLDKDPMSSKIFLDECMSIAREYILTIGFSVSKKDLFMSLNLRSIFYYIKTDLQDLHLHALKSRYYDLIISRDLVEGKVNLIRKKNKKIRSKFSETIDKLMQYTIGESNSFKVMLESGSKGNMINHVQILFNLGQQSIVSSIDQNLFEKRSFHHFPNGYTSLFLKGYIINSFLSGLFPHEFFYHAMSGREGIIDTSIKTAETGYIQRKFSKSMENLSVYQDRTLRNTEDQLIQFLYGEDGFDPCFIERQKVKNYSKSSFIPAQQHIYTKSNNKIKLTEILSDINKTNNLKHIRSFIEEDFKNKEQSIRVPLHIMRLVIQSRLLKENSEQIKHLKPKIYHSFVYAVLSFISNNYGSRDNCVELSEHIINSPIIRNIKSKLCYRHAQYYKMSMKNLLILLKKFKKQFLKSLITPGECVGVLAAQSIGEPTTQMTLNTFHFAGVAEKDVTVGVPRFNEIINCSKSIKVPCSYVSLKNDKVIDVEIIKFILANLEHITIHQIISNLEIYYLKYGLKIDNQHEKSLMENWTFEFFRNKSLNVDGVYQIFVSISRFMIHRKLLNLEFLVRKIKQHFNTKIAVLSSHDNSDKIWLNIYFPVNIQKYNDKKDKILHQNTLKNFLNDFLKISLKGIPGLYSCKISKNLNTLSFRSIKIRKLENSIVFDCLGVNFLKTLSFPWIYTGKSYCNSVIEFFELFGIEGARNIFIKELSKVLEFDGSYIDYHHLSCLADYCTFLGFLNPINRFGLKSQSSSVLQECSFEETTKTLIKASHSGNKDNFKSISEQIIIGSMCKLGTNFSNIMYFKNKEDIQLFENVKDNKKMIKHNLKIIKSRNQSIIEGLEFTNKKASASQIKLNSQIINFKTRCYDDWDY